MSKSKIKKVKGAKPYTEIKPTRDNYRDILVRHVENRRVMFNRLKAMYENDLALLEQAEQELNDYDLGKGKWEIEKREETTQ